jgi:biopolymer transport protein ExbB/TolQ
MKPLPRNFLLAGLVLALGGPFVGIFLTVIGMIVTFQTIGQHGIADPATLSGHMGLTLVATMAGLVAAVIGGGMIVTALVLHFAGRKELTSQVPR